MSDKACGYENHETFLVAFYIDNTKWAHDYWYGAARSYQTAGLGPDNLAESLEHVITLDAVPVEGLVGELLDASLNAVDWQDIAQNIWTCVLLKEV